MSVEAKLAAEFSGYIRDASASDEPNRYPQRMLAYMRLERFCAELMDNATAIDRARICASYRGLIAQDKAAAAPA